MTRLPRVLREPSFRYLFLGQSASNIGDQALIVALALYITRATGSASDLGFVLAAQALPLLVFIVLGGVVADRWGGPGRRRVMLAADVMRALLHATVATLILTGGASIPALIGLEALVGVARAFFQPAYSGLLPLTVGRDRLQQAQALSATTFNLAILVGPALGTGLVLAFGAGTAFALDAVTFVISAALIWRVRPGALRATAADDVDAPPSLRVALREGWSEVRSRPWFAATISAFTVAMFAGYASWNALAPLIARHLYGGASRFGVLESITGGGALLGAVIGMRWRPRRPLAVGLALTLIWPLMTGSFALGAPLALIIVLAFGAGAGFGLYDVFWETALGTHIPPEALSRVSSYDWMGSLALLPLGFALAGPLATVVGARTVLGGATVITAVALGSALLPRSTRSLPGPERLQSESAAGADTEPLTPTRT